MEITYERVPTSLNKGFTAHIDGTLFCHVCLDYNSGKWVATTMHPHEFRNVFSPESKEGAVRLAWNQLYPDRPI